MKLAITPGYLSTEPLQRVTEDPAWADARPKFGMLEKGVPFARRSAKAVVWATIGSVSLPIGAWAQERSWEWHPMWGMWGAWGIGMTLMMLVFWGLVIAGLVLGIRWLVTQGRESSHEPRSDTALEILRQRYARGEINRDEFEAKKRDLA